MGNKQPLMPLKRLYYPLHDMHPLKSKPINGKDNLDFRMVVSKWEGGSL